MRVFVVYGIISKIIRRIIVTDKDSSVVSLSEGENFLEVPFKEYTLRNANEIADYVAFQIGVPEHDGRCVEVDKDGKVVAVYNADPIIDKPTLDSKNTIEVNKDAVIGDTKQNGTFPIKPTTPPSDYPAT